MLSRDMKLGPTVSRRTLGECRPLSKLKCTIWQWKNISRFIPKNCQNTPNLTQYLAGLFLACAAPLHQFTWRSSWQTDQTKIFTWCNSNSAFTRNNDRVIPVYVYIRFVVNCASLMTSGVCPRRYTGTPAPTLWERPWSVCTGAAFATDHPSRAAFTTTCILRTSESRIYF